MLVGQETSYQFSARVGNVFVFSSRRHGQQQARFDFNQHRRHQQVFRSQIQVLLVHLRDIGQILLGDFEHGNIQHIDVLLADKIKQQIERAFKTVQHHLQRIGRDEKVGGQVGNRLAEQRGDAGAARHIGRGSGHVSGSLWRVWKAGIIVDFIKSGSLLQKAT